MSLKDKLHILVVDDMSTSRGLLTQALDELDYAVNTLGLKAVLLNGLVYRPLTDDPDALQGGPPVRAMLIQSANPAVSAPSPGIPMESRGFLLGSIAIPTAPRCDPPGQAEPARPHPGPTAPGPVRPPRGSRCGRGFRARRS